MQKITRVLILTAIAILLAGTTVLGAGPEAKYAYASTDKCPVCEQQVSAADDNQPAFTPMWRTPEQKTALAQLRSKAPQALIDQNIKQRLAGNLGGAHFDLFQYLQYTPSERNQNPSCGNCWVWADTGVMEIAMAVQNSIKDRLSIQYFDSNYNSGAAGNFACCGGDESSFVSFYQSKLKAIPWSNTNANFQDNSRSCSAGTAVSRTLISETPSYTITSIGPAQQISTYSATDTTNIANIKNVLNQNKAVVFDFYMVSSDWSTFSSWWSTQPNTAIWSGNFSCGANYNQTWAGHSVLCVGYDDTNTDPTQQYWILLNSWGTTSGRPDGTFRIPMHYNYQCSDSRGLSYPNTYWYTIPVTFTASISTPTVTNGTGATNTTTTSATLNGNLTSTGSQATTVTIYYGTTDGLTTTTAWASHVDVGTLSAGAFSSPVTGLTPNATYYYRCAATNASGTAWAGSSVSFVAAAYQKLFGVDDAAATSGCNGTGPNVLLESFTATANGSLTAIKVKTGGSSNVKVAVYADSNGSPSTLLAAVNTDSPVVTGWNSISISPAVSVTSGTNYWLSVVSSAYNICYMASSSSSVWKTVTYSTWTYPSTPGSGWTTQPGYTYFLSAWGSGLPPAPPSTPTITNSSGATNITSTTATLNGQLTSTGNENPTVHIYWGATDKGATSSGWDHDINLGTQAAGSFSSDISGLTLSTTYYYRCAAQNSAGTGWASSTASFTTAAAAPQKLFGVDDTAATSGCGGVGANVDLERFAATATGNLNKIKVKVGASSNVKVAIYADSNGSPSTLLAAVNTDSPVTAGWNSITISPSVPVTSGTYYWLGVVSSAYNVCYTASSASNIWKTVTYSSWTFPNSAGSGWNTQPGYTYFLSAWGDSQPPAPPTPPAAPALTSPGASVTFQWGTSTGAASYYLQVNTTQTFDGTSIFDSDVGNNTTQTVSGFSLGTTYYWRVKAGNSTGYGAWSPVRSILVSQLQ